MDTPTRAYLSLALTPGLGPRKIKLLSEHFGDAEAVYEAGEVALRQVEGIGPKLVRAIMQARDSDEPEKELARAEKLKVRILHLSHPEYPESLRHIYDPPPVLYVRGTLPGGVQGEVSGLRALGMVGTRDASDYALELSKSVATALATAGIVVVSGLALGVDSAAHQGAMSVPGGQTIAVLGSGVDIIYPSQNGSLARRILDGHGAIVSEYRLGTRPRAENFPGRNRIINGLCRGVAVIEAGVKSGALITADYALDEGRTIFAVPGRVGDPRAKGALELLRQGAVLTQSADDILSEFGWEGAGSPAEAQQDLAQLNELQRLVLGAIVKEGSPLLDDLISATGMSTPELLSQLTLLELQGIIKTVPGGRYIALTKLQV